MSLRIDAGELQRLDARAFDLIAECYRSRKIRLLAGLVRRNTRARGTCNSALNQMLNRHERRTVIA